MPGLLQWIIGVFILTAIGLYMARRWLDEQDKKDHFKDGPP